MGSNHSPMKKTIIGGAIGGIGGGLIGVGL